MPDKEKKKPAVKARAPKVARKKPASKKKVAEVVEQAPAQAQPQRVVERTYLFAVGRRKTAVARVRLFPRGNGTITVNGKPIDQYFPTRALNELIRKPLEISGHLACDFSVKVSGGGVHSQAESVRHGIARALLLAEPSYRKVLKPAGFLTRDARVKERKKYGLKRARRAPQWQKR